TSPISLMLNIVIIPIVSILVPILALVLLSYYIPILGTIIAFVAKNTCEFTIKLIDIAKIFENWVIKLPTPSLFQIISFIVIIILLLPGIIRVSRKRRAILLSSTLVIFLVFSAVLKQNPLAYTQINVGQADCAVIRDYDYTIVIDTGETGIELSNYLKRYNRGIDALFITHLHNDHAGGIESLIKNDIPIKNVYISKWAQHADCDEYSKELLQLLRDNGFNISEVVAGDNFYYKNTNIKVMFPEDTHIRPGKDPNDSAMALLINIGNCNILSMSDVTSKYEKYAAHRADIIKVGHHGSKTSTSETFLNNVRPSMAIITSSIKSKTIPHIDVINNLHDKNVSIFRSDVHGDINIYFDNTSYQVKTYTNKEQYEQR
ncbi:MAG: MBL fold metallo-hydrolase, partial [Christensenellaceae bacterium]|nr:MBL fold metallo-hydrolase [Christensenellaceae bacterium]